ncbi:bifunctional metallophosphatase/5'-nucleotidase [Brevibacterium sp. UCMA 11754]|uniref:bifunctional metallophosphatase/5'-nucleotidase n=1 Tax=Brevibacterium sp. UCMA 11754 TaxID=2749198 RepID=UPI001F1D8D0F|nr:bifunctional UDP-sugar hydrolase/5'-nucleotidase [Brevibacterium sp. UCMA 11754]MCF2573720.1 bifunctional metallophosphatase/5'-nucleotidase [Brevibacterium sp. UCMA 11754]
MSKLVTKMLATGAAVSMLTLPGAAPAVASSLGGDSVREAPAEASLPDPSSDRSSLDGSSDAASSAAEAGAGTSAGKTADADKTADKDASAQAAAEGTKVQLLNITDFHGRIAEAGTELASVVEEERAKYAAAEGTAGTGFLSAGDNIGASTYVSSSQQDAPTLDVLNAIGAQASAVGNHEFDQGIDDLTGRVSSESDFPYLAANVYDKGTTDVVDGLDGYTTIDVGGVKVAVIGVVTKDTKSLVSPAGIADLEFGDPTDAVNRVAGEIEALPADEQPDMTVVEAHLGASSTKSLGDAQASNAEFDKLVTEADASVDVLFTGHTHLPYSFEAPVPGEPDRTRPVVEAGSYGEYVGQVQLEADAEGNWTTENSDLIKTEKKSYDSPVVDEVAKIIADADEKAKVPGSVVAGEISEDITRATKDGEEDRGAESTLGNLVADALKDGVEGTQLDEADFGITNPGGLRTDLRCDDIYNTEDKCEVTAAELSSVLPFANDHGVVTMQGSDVIGLFEEQWQPADASRPFLHLGISDELEVVYDSDAAEGEHVKSVEVDGKKLDPDKEYRVATLSFLAAGGDNFSSFAEGDFELSGLTDFETWIDYFEKTTDENEKVSPDNDERQADLTKDVIDNGDLTVDLAAPDNGIEPGESKDFVLNTTAEAEVPGPVDVTVDLPEGYTVSAADSQSARAQKAAKSETAKAPEVKVDAAAKTMSLESIPAGASDVAINVTAPDDASGEVTVEVGLKAGEGEWWDDNPLPVSHEFEATAQIGDEANAAAGDDGGVDGTSDVAGSDANSNSNASADGGAGGDDGSGSGANADGANADVSGATSANADGSGVEADGSKDGGDLPRTGFEAMNLVAAALALIVAGSMAVTVVRRRKNTV